MKKPVTRRAAKQLREFYAPDGEMTPIKERNKPVDREGPIHRAILAWLRVALPRQSVVFHCPNGGTRNAVAGAKLKALGTMAGIPDLCMIVLGKVYFLEVKSQIGKPSPEQIAVFGKLEQAGAYVAVARSVDEARDALRKWGVAIREIGT